MFECCVCKGKLTIPKSEKGQVTLSNVQRHIGKRCWLKETTVKGKASDRRCGITNYFKEQSVDKSQESSFMKKSRYCPGDQDSSQSSSQETDANEDIEVYFLCMA